VTGALQSVESWRDDTVAWSTSDDAPHGERPAFGSRIGRYVVFEEIGRGGMGRVLRAYDPKLRREVALKAVRSATLGRAGARRLVAEARAMAKLSHQNVVAVYDVEELAADEVVLVMEYVAGETMTEWLRQPRAWTKVVATFRQAGRGLVAAHAAGLLHRDFKPDNVLVARDGRARVTDFGLAREVVLERTGESTPAPARVRSTGDHTLTGAIVGTLPYLAPERLRGAAADTATDQFAFCVSLWQALFGARPFAGRTVGELAFAMTAGRPQPPIGAPKVPPWLVEVVARGLANDARERWPSIDALLHALARDPARRRRRWSIAALGIGAVGVAAIGVVVWDGVEACSTDDARTHLHGVWDDARRDEVREAMASTNASYAPEVWTRTEHALDAYASAWARMHVDACAATTIRGEQSPAVLDLRMACLHRARDGLSAAVDILATADVRTVRNAHDVTGNLAPLDRCADAEALQSEVEPPRADEADAVQRVRAHLAHARAAALAGHYAEAQAAVDAATEEARDLEYGSVRTEATYVRGWMADRNGDYEGAREALQETLRLAAQWQQWDKMYDAAQLLLYVVGYRMGRFEEAHSHGELAAGLAVGDPVREARVADALATVLHARGRFEEAEAHHRRGLALRERALGSDHVNVAASRNNLATLLVDRGAYDEAELLQRRALASWEVSLGASHPIVGQAHHNLANTLHFQGRIEESETEYRRAIALLEAALGPDHPDPAASRHNLANILTLLGQHEAAEAEHRRALPVLEKAYGADNPRVAQARHNFAVDLEKQGEIDEAEAHYRRSLAAFEAVLPEDHPHVAGSRRHLANVLLERGAIDEARPLAESAWTGLQRDDASAAERGHAAFVLARTIWAGGDAHERSRAIDLAEAAAAALDDAGDTEHERAVEVRAWLDRHRSPD
jgi:tetratricopeptide (TPR) repeat protein